MAHQVTSHRRMTDDGDDGAAVGSKGGAEGDAASAKVPLLSEEDAKKLATPTSTEGSSSVGAKHLVFCFVGLQASYLTWGYVQEKVMTRVYTTGKFPSATFCVFSNRVLAVLIAMAITLVQHKGRLALPAPWYAFAPCALSNSLSSFGQYQALRYVSFPLQTISKSTKVIPVMLMGKLLNKKTYPTVDYVEALVISIGVSLFSLANSGSVMADSSGPGGAIVILGVSMLGLYVISDSFTSQWQSKLYQAHPTVDQFQMMFAVNTWAIIMTLFALVTSGELVATIKFLRLNPVAGIDNVTIAITSATGQLFIFYTIKTFGPVVFTIIMTTRQVFSIVLSCIIFGHSIPIPAMAGALAVFGAIFHRIKRQAKSAKNRSQQKSAPAAPAPAEKPGDGAPAPTPAPNGVGPSKA